MVTRNAMLLRLGAGVLSLGLLTLAPLSSASAQGIFESIFGGLRRTFERPAERPPAVQSYAPPGGYLEQVNPAPRVEHGPDMAFCVRSCDGHFFPVQTHGGMSAVEACHAFCPASKTRVYSGSAIDHAAASDGSRYADLDTAFLYRKQVVAGCTCNGHDQFGLVHIDVKTDPTLRPGDVVATRNGMVAFTGKKDQTAEFTPVHSYSRMSKSERDKLSAIRIMPPTPGESQATALPLRDDNARNGDARRNAQR